MDKKEEELISIYQAKRIESGQKQQIVFDFGANVLSEKNELLYDKDEHFLVRESMTYPFPIESILNEIDINFPQCWVLIEFITKKLVPNFKHNIPGDIDIIVGKIIEGDFSFDYLLGIEAKLRKVRSNEELKDFPSGIGTTQSANMVELGFDRSLLIHYLVRETKEVPEGYAASWNPIINSEFSNGIKACKGLLQKNFVKNRSPYGYAVMGWGQAYSYNWKECGGIQAHIMYEPPLRPFKDKTNQNREILIHSIKEILGKYKVNKYPFILDYKEIFDNKS